MCNVNHELRCCAYRSGKQCPISIMLQLGWLMYKWEPNHLLSNNTLKLPSRKSARHLKYNTRILVSKYTNSRKNENVHVMLMMETNETTHNLKEKCMYKTLFNLGNCFICDTMSYQMPSLI